MLLRLARLARSGLVRLLALALYTLLVAYDVRVWTVVPSAWHYLRIPVDPSIVNQVPQPVPRDPVAIDRYVQWLLPWAQDSDVFGLPWVFPTPRQAIRYRRGDCEAQAVVLASLLAARAVPYSFRASFSHLWVDYPGRPVEPGERPAEAMMQNVGGKYRFHWPELPELKEHWDTQVSLLWTPLHPVRKILLVIGWPLLLVWPRRRRGDGA